jgi:hypothetical protein
MPILIAHSTPHLMPGSSTYATFGITPHSSERQAWVANFFQNNKNSPLEKKQNATEAADTLMVVTC